MSIVANSGFFFNDPLNPTSAVDLSGSTTAAASSAAAAAVSAAAAAASAASVSTANCVPLVGGVTVTGTLGINNTTTIGGSAGTNKASLVMNGDPSQFRGITWKTGSTNSWQQLFTGTRSGSNAGDDIFWRAFADDGSTQVGDALQLRRSDLRALFGGIVQAKNFTVNNSTIALTAGGPSTAFSPLWLQGSYNGTLATSGIVAKFNQVMVNADQVTVGNGNTITFDVTNNFGGGSSAGGRTGISSSLVQAGTCTDRANGYSSPFFVAGVFNTFARFNAGGTNTTLAGSCGYAFGLNPQVTMSAACTNWREISGGEVNVSVASGASVNRKTGWKISKLSTDAVQAADVTQDSAISIADQVGVTAGWLQGITFGNNQAQWPMDALSTLIGAFPGSNPGTVATQAAYGIDLSNVTFSSGFLKSTGFLVDGAGNTKVASLTTAVSYQTPSTGFTTTIGANTGTLVLNPSGTLASGTVTLPAAPQNGQRATISSSQTITTLTVSPNSGQAVVGAPSTIGATSPVSFVYSTLPATPTWFRI